MDSRLPQENPPGTVVRTPSIRSYAIGIGLVTITCFLVIVVIYYRFSSSREFLKFVVPAAGVAGGIAGAFYIGDGLRQNARNSSRNSDVNEIILNKIESTNETILNKIENTNKTILNKIESTNETILNKIESTNETILNKIEKENQINRSYKLISEWQDSQFYSKRRAAKKIRLLIKDEESDQQSIAIQSEMAENETFRFDVIDTLNELEKIARLIDSGAANEEILYKHYRGEVISWHDMFTSWIAQLRKHKRNQRLYEAFTGLYDKWVDEEYRP